MVGVVQQCVGPAAGSDRHHPPEHARKGDGMRPSCPRPRPALSREDDCGQPLHDQGEGPAWLLDDREAHRDPNPEVQQGKAEKRQSLKDAEPAELLRAIRVVAAGEALLSPSVTRRVVSLFGRHLAGGTPPAPGLDALTDREREMRAWVTTGRSNQEIAKELFLSPATVRTHISRAMGKLGARDRAQLVVFAVRAGLTIPEE